MSVRFALLKQRKEVLMWWVSERATINSDTVALPVKDFYIYFGSDYVFQKVIQYVIRLDNKIFSHY